MDSGKELRNQIILISDNRITAVGEAVEIPAGATIIDLSNMTVLPGLIDCHTHLADGARDPSGDPLTYLKRTAAEVALESVPNARLTLESGFTTVRDVGVYRALTDVALRDAIARGDIPGPRMYVAGAYVTITGGAGALTGAAPDIQLPWDLRYGQADSPWEVRAVIRKLANNGADHIKILSSGAVLEHGSNPNSQEFTMEELRAAVEEAAAFGLRVEAHAHSTQGIKNAILAGVASVEHASMIDDEGIALAKQHGTYLDMDIYDEECIEDEARHGAIPADFVQHDASARPNPARQFPQSRRRRRENVLRHRRRRLPLRHSRAPIRVHGPIRHDAATSNPSRHQQRSRSARSQRRPWLDQARKIRRHHRRASRPAARRPRPGKRQLCNERRESLQTEVNQTGGAPDEPMNEIVIPQASFAGGICFSSRRRAHCESIAAYGNPPAAC